MHFQLQSFRPSGLAEGDSARTGKAFAPAESDKLAATCKAFTQDEAVLDAVAAAAAATAIALCVSLMPKYRSTTTRRSGSKDEGARRREGNVKKTSSMGLSVQWKRCWLPLSVLVNTYTQTTVRVCVCELFAWLCVQTL